MAWSYLPTWRPWDWVYVLCLCSVLCCLWPQISGRSIFPYLSSVLVQSLCSPYTHPSHGHLDYEILLWGRVYNKQKMYRCYKFKITFTNHLRNSYLKYFFIEKAKLCAHINLIVTFLWKSVSNLNVNLCRSNSLEITWKSFDNLLEHATVSQMWVKILQLRFMTFATAHGGSASADDRRDRSECHETLRSFNAKSLVFIHDYWNYWNESSVNFLY